MSSSLIGADRRTHCKIVVLALASAMTLVVLGSTAWRAQTDRPTAHANETVLKVGKPVMSATAGEPVIR
jgi:hypothetical protein